VLFSDFGRTLLRQVKSPSYSYPGAILIDHSACPNSRPNRLSPHGSGRPRAAGASVPVLSLEGAILSRIGAKTKSSVSRCVLDVVSIDVDLDHPATSLGRASEIATQPPTPADRRTIDHPQHFWDCGGKSRPAHPRLFSKKKSDLASALAPA
jgi:hypothetical protein